MLDWMDPELDILLGEFDTSLLLGSHIGISCESSTMSVRGLLPQGDAPKLSPAVLFADEVCCSVEGCGSSVMPVDLSLTAGAA